MAEAEKSIGVKELKDWIHKHKKRLFAGAGLALCIVLAVAGLLYRAGLQRQAAKPTDTAEIGMVDLQKVLKAHDAYDQLKSLQEQREVMAADLAVEREETLSIQPPELQAEPFQFAQQQKAAQEKNTAGGELAAQRQEAVRARRAATEPAYKAQKDELDAEYLNALFNLRMKLDNADAMRLSPAQCDELQAQMSGLQHERGARQQALRDAYEGSIRAYDAALRQQDEQKLQSMAQQQAQNGDAAALTMQTTAQDRDTQAMAQHIMATEERAQRIAEKKAALVAKDAEIQAMEDHMLNDIAGKAAKLAIMHHLTMIVTNPSVNLQAVDVGMLHVGPWPEKYTPAIGVGTMDLTDDLVNELKE